jgi:hypothetical protein
MHIYYIFKQKNVDPIQDTHPLTMSKNYSNPNEYLAKARKGKYEDSTSASAFLIIGAGGSGLLPGCNGIPKNASTAFFGGGKRYKVINLIALAFVWAAT